MNSGEAAVLRRVHCLRTLKYKYLIDFTYVSYVNVLVRDHDDPITVFKRYL